MLLGLSLKSGAVVVLAAALVAVCKHKVAAVLDHMLARQFKWFLDNNIQFVQADHHAVGVVAVVWLVIHHTHVMRPQLTHYVYVHQVAGAGTHNVLQAGTAVIAVFHVFAELLVEQTFHYVVYGAVIEIQVAPLTHITLPQNQLTLVAV